jgi:hypothetical protein
MSQPRTRRQRRPFVPHLEALEGRDVPCTVVYGQGLLGGTDLFSHDLLIRGGRKREAIVVNDNGTPDGVVVLCNGATVWSGNQPVYGIIVDTGSANWDSVTYNLTADLVGATGVARVVRVKLGRGKADSFEGNLNGNIAGILALQVNGGGGGDRIEAHLRGNLYTSGSYSSLLELDLTGGSGRDVIGFDALPGVEVGPGVDFNVSLDGGAGNDTIDAAYAGEMRGLFFFDAQGGAGNDSVSAALTFEGNSDGLLYGPPIGGSLKNGAPLAAQVDGGKGNDRLSLVVHHGPELHGRAIIDGGPGFNTCHAEGNVDGVFHC